MNTTHALVFSIVALLAPSAHATDPPPPPIVNGSTTTDVPAVVFLTAATGGGWGGVCSGTLIAPKWVITAAHCVEDAEDIDIYFGHDITGSGAGVDRMVWVRDWIPHPGYTGSSTSINHDIALVELGTTITDVTPMPLNEDEFQSSWIGDELTYVGFGITADGRDDSGVKRFARIPIDSYDSTIVYGLDPDDQNVCQGDSGGAALRRMSDGNYELMGVNSFVYAVWGGGGRCL